MGIRNIVALALLGGSLAFGSTVRAERVADRPDGGPPLIAPPAVAPATAPEQPGKPAPRAQDSTRTPMPDRDALPKDLQDARLAPPTPPVPQSSGTKTGGGPARVKDIF